MINPHLIKRPIITEKTVALASAENIYTFEVARTADKNQIKEAIAQIYGVKVERVNTVTGHYSTKSAGRKRLRVSVAPVKKAIVKVQKGQTINVFDFGGQEEGNS